MFLEIITIAALVLIITLSFLWLNKFLPFKICPICAGVSLAWLFITAGVLVGQLPITDYQLPVAILMGGTVVGIAYQGEQRFKWAQSQIFRFKAPVIILGFILAYWSVMNMNWVVLFAEGAIISAITYLFFVMPNQPSLRINPDKPENEQHKADIRQIEEKLKNCC